MRAPAVVVVAVAVIAVAALPSVATAQPGIAIPMRPVDPASHPGAKSESTAFALSLGGTLASYAGFALALKLLEDADDDDDEASDDHAGQQALFLVAAAGTWVGPSLGHWYTGKVFTRGLGFRAAAAGTGLVAAMWALSECGILEDNCENSGGPTVLLISAAGLWIWGTVDDIATAGAGVREYNRGLVSDVAVVPIVRSDGGSVALTGRF